MSSSRASSFIVLGRVMRYAFQNMARNIGLVFITISILILSLASVSALVTVRALAQSAVHAVEQQVDISLFFSPTAKPQDVEAAKSFVQARPEVKTVDFIDPDQALADFKNRHQDNTEILKSLDVLDANPLGAIVIVRTNDTKDYHAVLDAIQSQPFSAAIQKRSFEDRAKIIDNVYLFTSRLEKFSLWLAVLFVIIAILIVFNAIRVAIYTQREEIAIKKLVGATNGFIRAPFFIEGLVYVLVSVSVLAGLVYAASRVVDPFLGPLITQGGFSVYNLFFGQWYYSFGILFVGMLAITWLTSILAMRKYLRT